MGPLGKDVGVSRVVVGDGEMRLTALCDTGGCEVGGGTGGVLDEILVKGGVAVPIAVELFVGLCISVGG